ncbi:hypothetical protein DL766_004601 [Monosporascus sp. MC13-8B]|uniref:Uncharacterized protein n=1 Tax=Monosporascus cannonballus TaxID=155416 RepID=A0ABY0HBC5_9PEZI|nr:hypothetical protein DL762_003168 [Monosporascus cannonballus]RYP30987.1 hypothetical protein DL766_004601 [Monosporascus sp. MC13-8B]
MSNSSDVSAAASSPATPEPRPDDIVLSARPSPTGFTEHQRFSSSRSSHMHLRPPSASGTGHSPSRSPINHESSFVDSPRSTPAGSRPIAIELPTTKKVNSAPVYTPPAPLSARGDLPGGYFPLHEEQPEVYRPHPFQLDASKARKKSIQLASWPSPPDSQVFVSNITATGTIAFASSPKAAPAAAAAASATSAATGDQPARPQPDGASSPNPKPCTPVTSYNPSPYQENALPMGKYYPSNYEKRKMQKQRPQISDITSSPMKSDTQVTTARQGTMAGHARHESEAKRRLAQYQRDMIAQAAMALGGSGVNRAAVPTLANIGFSSLPKPDKPRLQPLGSPGPVTPMELEGADGYLDARASGEEAQKEEIAKAMRLDAKRRRREGASSPVVELGPGTC